ncbi:MAG: 2,3-bisphosphoglycerate-independent phosphoglycerate mutase [Thermodesulfobacteriota bacterium]|nr:2,3-bisphosphoglycerate-independent phosphoglycerate mutase [Thermodesulfobacteriota bacterium]
MKQPCMLVILDGWGINQQPAGNAVAAANTPNLDRLFENYPHTELVCSGEAVGLPPGFMGNSEVGHLNIGAGRIVYQELMKINIAIDDGSFFTNETLLSIMAATKSKEGTLHLMGLVSDGGVHSHINHLKALIQMGCKKGLQVRIHAILDGRDTPPDSGKGYIADLENFLASYDTASIATICGRYYAMDRDTRWDRTEKAYRLYTRGEGKGATDPGAAVEQAYAAGETDEFVTPVTITGDTINDNDGVVFFNFRADRARQIVRAFTDPEFDEFERSFLPALSGFVCMTLYDKTFTAPVAFPPENPALTLGEVISSKGLAQLRIAETEKYAHVTYFFNGGVETPFEMEDRKLIPSPREVATYDEKPEMSAHSVADELVARIEQENYSLIVVNFANMDMVGHTGIFEAAVTACETVDACVGQIIPAFLKNGGAAIVTADHGNAEQMTAENGSPHTAHTQNRVPMILVDDNRKTLALQQGKLGDIAPTLLTLMGFEQPGEMTGVSLLAAS